MLIATAVIQRNVCQTWQVTMNSIKVDFSCLQNLRLVVGYFIVVLYLLLICGRNISRDEDFLRQHNTYLYKDRRKPSKHWMIRPTSATWISTQYISSTSFRIRTSKPLMNILYTLIRGGATLSYRFSHVSRCHSLCWRNLFVIMVTDVSAKTLSYALCSVVACLINIITNDSRHTEYLYSHLYYITTSLHNRNNSKPEN